MAAGTGSRGSGEHASVEAFMWWALLYTSAGSPRQRRGSRTKLRDGLWKSWPTERRRGCQGQLPNLGARATQESWMPSQDDTQERTPLAVRQKGFALKSPLCLCPTRRVNLPSCTGAHRDLERDISLPKRYQIRSNQYHGPPSRELLQQNFHVAHDRPILSQGWDKNGSLRFQETSGQMADVEERPLVG